MSNQEQISSGDEQNGKASRRKKHHHYKPKKIGWFKKTKRWIRSNPLKTIAIFSVALIIYVTIMFYMNNVDVLNTNEAVVNPKYKIKGLLVPDIYLLEKTPLYLQLGSYKTTLALDQLKHGVAISPMALSTCETIKRRRDPTKFFIFLEGKRLFASTSFRDIESEEILGNVNKQHLKLFSEEHATYHSEDKFIEVLDAGENVVFNMQFSEPGHIRLQGYFISSSCVYIATGDSLYAFQKSGTYVQQALPEIRKINKIYNYDVEQ